MVWLVRLDKSMMLDLFLTSSKCYVLRVMSSIFDSFIRQQKKQKGKGVKVWLF